MNMLITLCHRLIYVHPPNSHVEALTPALQNVLLFEDRGFKMVIKDQ